ncbi:MAG: FAD-binding oxidoreductase [Bacillota bacterium]
MDPRTEPNLHAITDVAADPSTRERYAVDGMLPSAVARPGSEAEVSAVLKLAASLGMAVVPWGAGSSQDLGHPPERVDLVLSLERLNQVVEYVPADMTITVQAGMRLAELQALTASQGQTLPLDPPRAGRKTIGGLVATALAGPRRMAYGGVRDLLLGSRVALADGRVIKTGGRVVKNVAGYDMNKLLCGSLGTLGVVTEATFKLRPLPAQSRTLVAGFPDLASALAAGEAVLNSELLPAALVVLAAGAARRLELPGRATLAVLLEETPENVAYQAARLPALTGVDVDLLDEGEAAALWGAVTNFGDRFGAAYQIRVNTVIADLERCLQLGESTIAYMGTGTVMLYGWEAEAGQVAGQMEAAAMGGGWAVLEAAPVTIRRVVEPWGPPRPEWRLMRAIKERFDPGRILNRGRFVGGM